MSNDMEQVQCLYYDNQKSENNIAAEFLHKSIRIIMEKEIQLRMVVNQMLAGHIRKTGEITHQDGNRHKAEATGTYSCQHRSRKFPNLKFSDSFETEQKETCSVTFKFGRLIQKQTDYQGYHHPHIKIGNVHVTD